MGIVKMLDKLEKILGRESCDGLAPYLGRGEGGNNFCHFLPRKVGLALFR